MNTIVYLCLFFSFSILLFAFVYWIIKKRKYEKQINNQADYIWEKYLEKFKEKQLQIEEEEKKLDSDIKEKENFNNTLFKIREDELNRLIQEKKKEQINLLNIELAIYERNKRKEAEQNLIDYLNELEKKKKNSEEEIEKIKTAIEDFRIQRAAINEAILREKEIQEQQNFYRICVSENDQADIEVLKTIAPQLKNREALNKLIYDVFIKRPLGEMIKRITNGKDISGIYKITYLKTGEAYIGKSVNIKDRWISHTKTVLGVSGGAAKALIHDHMSKNGIWNYSWEILEEVPKDKLTEREKFYIELYQTDKQLNMRVG